MATRNIWRPQMTRNEQRQGWVFFVLYLLVFPILLSGVLWTLDDRFELYFSVAASNFVYYLLIAALLVVVFWDFLTHATRLLLDWLPENLFAMGTGLLVWIACSFLTGLIPLSVTDPTPLDHAQQFLLARGQTIAIVVVLKPIVEEFLFRGLLFGSLRKRSRALAYLLCVPAFALYCVWQFAMPMGDAAYLLLAVRYLPAALALAWCYDNGGSIWSPTLLHMLISAVSLALAVR